MSDGGWIKLHRRALDSTVFEAGPIIWMVWCWCLMKASHKPYKVPFAGKDVEYPAGSFITGIYSALEQLNRKPNGARKKKPEDKISYQQYRTAIKYLIATNRITIKSSNRFSCYYINNWHKYQDINQHINKQLTSSQQAANNNQEVQEVQEAERKLSTASVHNSRPAAGAYAPRQEANTIVHPEKFVEEFHRRKAQGWRAEYGRDLVVIGANNEIRLKIHNGQFVGYSDDLRKIIWKRSK